MPSASGTAIDGKAGGKRDLPIFRATVTRPLTFVASRGPGQQHQTIADEQVRAVANETKIETTGAFR
jgi:hypothetical protein